MSESKISLTFDESDEEFLTAEKLLEKLQTAWINEKLAPEILPHQTEILDIMMQQILHIEENTSNVNNNDLRAITHQMEIERIRYILTAYLRNRLKKLERYSKSICKEESTRSSNDKFLSQFEAKFVSEYKDYSECCLHNIALQYMPGILKSQIEQGYEDPNITSHVILKAKIAVSSVATGDDEDFIDLTDESIHIVPYQFISDLILSGSARLI